MAEIVLSMMQSLDGYIADQNLEFDFIEGYPGPHLEELSSQKQSFDFDDFVGKVDIIVMGMTSYQQGFHLAYPDKAIYVVTSKKINNQANLHFLAPQLLLKLILAKRKQGKSSYILGGGMTAQLFISADAVDRYVIGTVPYLQGSGRKLFYPQDQAIPLQLETVQVLGGMTLCQYLRRS